MLRTDKPIYKVILVLNLLFIVAGVASCVISIASQDANITRIICLILAIACLVFAAFYILNGYTKDAAKYYKMYGTFLALKCLADTLSVITNNGMPFGTVIRTLCLVIILVLLLSENLGKTKSLILCGLFVALRVTLLIYSITIGINPKIFIIGNIVNIDLACLFGIMTYAKYLN